MLAMVGVGSWFVEKVAPRALSGGGCFRRESGNLRGMIVGTHRP